VLFGREEPAEGALGWSEGSAREPPAGFSVQAPADGSRPDPSHRVIARADAIASVSAGARRARGLPEGA